MEKNSPLNIIKATYTKGTTDNQKAYNKELKRIENFIKRKTKEGHSFELDFLPEKPQRVSQKAIERLQNIKPKDIYEHGTYFDNEKEIFIDSSDYMKKKRSEASKKGWRTRRKKKKIGVRKPRPDDNEPDFTPPGISIIPQATSEWLQLEYIILEIPESRYVSGGKVVNTGELRDKLLNTWARTYARYKENNQLNKLDEYLDMNRNEFQRAIEDIIVFDSEESGIRQHYADLQKFLSADSVISLEDAKQLDDYIKYFESEE